MKSTKSDLLDRLEGWNEESIRLLTAMLERIAELPDAELAKRLKLLADWMQWERGELPPGRVMSNLKTHGLREVLEGLGAGGEEPGGTG